MKKRLTRIIISGILFVTALLIKFDPTWINTVLFLLSYIIVGYDIIFKAFRNILHGKVFDENFLMTVATIGAMIISEYPEGVAVMLFYQVGELFQSYAVSKSRKSIADLMDIRPDYANLKRGDDIITVDPDEVHIGDYIVIKPGEKVPLDGRVVDGYSMVDTSALTGESVPRDVQVGSDLLSGCININGLITAEVTKEFEESTVNQILDLVENASSKKSQSERFITRFSRYYTPIVVILAVLLAIIPPLLVPAASWNDWIYRALAFLVVSCPCALVLSIPLSFFSGIGGASRKGILVKGANHLEDLAKTETIVFDKTGTLTKGVFKVQEINPQGISKEDLLELTAHAESFSNHPISSSLKEAYGRDIETGKITETEEIPGHGVIANVDGQKVAAGNNRLMDRLNISYNEGQSIGTTVHVAIDGKYAGYILIADEIKDDAGSAIQDLKKSHIENTVMLTGDLDNVANHVANELGIDQVYSQLLPGDKVDKVEELLSQKSEGRKLAFVGDGINDAPVLTRADIGIAMGALGSDAAIEAADIVIMTDQPSKISTAIKISKKTLRIARQNTIFAIGIKILVLILSALGLTTLWAAIFADVGVTIIAVLNSFRAMKI